MADVTGDTLTLSTTLSCTDFNPYKNIKNNNLLNVSSISNFSSDTLVPQEIALIYIDLAKGKLKNAVDISDQGTCIMKTSIQPFEIKKTGEQQLIGKPIGIPSFPNNSRAQFDFPLISGKNGNSSTQIFMSLYYSLITKNWTNDGCQIENSSESTGSVPASCDHVGVGPNKKGISIKNEMSLVVDIINDVGKVLMSGNYKLLTNFGAFTSAPMENYIVFGGVLLFFLLVAYLTYNAYKKDKRDVYEEKIKALNDKFLEKEEFDQGLLFRIYNLFSQMKTKGTKDAFQNLQPQDPENTSPSSKIIKKKNPNAKRIPPNGFSILEPYSAKEIKDLFHLYDEHKDLFSKDELYKLLKNHIKENVALNRITQVNIDDAIIKEPPSFCTILKVNNIY